MSKSKDKEESSNDDEFKEEQLERIERISQEVFGKPSKDIKYVLVTNFIHNQLLEEELTRTGLYQWINVFDGDIVYPRDLGDPNEYDIVQVNLSVQDIPLVGDIQSMIDEDSNTKLVVNNDYTSEMWNKSFPDPNFVGREVRKADMVFGTEYFQVTALSEMIGRKCFVVPHPADVRRLKSLDPIPKKDVISTVWRRYDNHAYVPSLASRNHGLTTQLIGYDKDKDPRFHLTTTLYDYVFAGTNYFDFCDQLRESQVVYDPFTYHSYSRTTVDTAALGVPVVVSNRTQSGRILYPHTSIDPYDVNKARQLISKLLNDDEFREKVVETARERVEFYNHTNSKERYLVALEESLEEEVEDFTPRKPRVSDKGRGDDVLELKSEEINRKPRVNRGVQRA